MTRILIIEDDLTLNQMYRMKFETEGFVVRMAKDGRVGMKLASSFAPDLILLDMQMPGMDGVEALRHIRKDPMTRITPVVILTNLGEEEAPREMQTLNVERYLVKAECTPRQVVALVKDILGLNEEEEDDEDEE